MAAGSRTGSVVAVAVVSLLGAAVAFFAVWALTPTQAAPAAAVPAQAATQPPEPTPPPTSGPQETQTETGPSLAAEPPVAVGPTGSHTTVGPRPTPSETEAGRTSALAQATPAVAGGPPQAPSAPSPPTAAPPTLVPAVWSAVIAGLTGVLAAAALTMARRRGPRGVTPPPGGNIGIDPARQTVPPPADPQVPALLAQRQMLLMQRTALLRGLADLLARLPKEFAWQAAKLLEAAGARRVEPGGGAPFDPAAHQIIDTVPTDDARHDDTVARLLRAGWRDENQVLVPAHVVVYAVPEHRSADGPR